MAKKPKEQVIAKQVLKTEDFEKLFTEYFISTYSQPEQTVEQSAMTKQFCCILWNKMTKEFSFSELELFIKFMNSAIYKKMRETNIQSRYEQCIYEVNESIMQSELEQLLENTDLEETGTYDFQTQSINTPTKH